MNAHFLNFINNHWMEGEGELFDSCNPATAEVISAGFGASIQQITHSIKSAKIAQISWASLSISERISYLDKVNQVFKNKQDDLALCLSIETGKPLWESLTEIQAMIGKLSISVEAYDARTGTSIKNQTNEIKARLVHRPHGVLVVLGPYNFPGHIPNGHIMPALIAGNTVILKPSELTPAFSVEYIRCFEEAGLPIGVINLVHGKGNIGAHLAEHPETNGVLFTGSSKTGFALINALANQPEKILALEMGGHNPLVVWDSGNIDAAVYHTIQSAYITAGQRCTCARRLILPKDKFGKSFLDNLISKINQIQYGPYTQEPEPYMGPVISSKAADLIVSKYNNLIKQGAKSLVELKKIEQNLGFLTPGLIEITDNNSLIDTEIFGPLLQVAWAEQFNDAVSLANKTKYGLSAGIFTEDEKIYAQFKNQVRAGIINWNRPLTGASSQMPFGGVGHSGNYRPSAYYAADYCAYPVASLESTVLTMPETVSPGLTR